MRFIRNTPTTNTTAAIIRGVSLGERLLPVFNLSPRAASPFLTASTL
jgi:hypothetical protein